MKLLAVLCLSACSYAHVGSGQVAVVRTPGGIDRTVYTTGDWKIGGDDHATLYDARSQEHAERLEVQASDGLGIVLDTSVRFHIIPDEVVALHTELGERYYDVLLGPTLRSQARRVVGRYKPDEIYSSERDAIEKLITEGVQNAIKGRHVAIEAVLVRGVTLPPEIQQAITNKLEAEQLALKMKFVLAQQQAENEKALMLAKADAEREQIAAASTASAQKIAAEGNAEAKRIDAQATSDAQALIQKFLTPQIIRLREIEAEKALAASPNAKLVLMGQAGGSTRIDLR